VPPHDHTHPPRGRIPAIAPRRGDEAAALQHRADDEADLRAERLRYDRDGPLSIEPCATLEALLEPGELVRAVEAGVVALGRPGDQRLSAVPASKRRFAVTSRRLLHLDPAPIVIRLEDVEDAAITPDRLLLILEGGQSLVLGTDRPRLLRFHISRARAERAAALRGSAGRGHPPAR
jgi:hypothetical protein